MSDATERVDRPLYGGGFVLADGSQAAFVLPGEVIDAESAAVMLHSPDRVAPRCVHFGACGGCQYQHAAYPVQVEWKWSILMQCLRATGLTEIPEIRTEAGEPWAYRNRIRLRVRVEGERVLAGYSRRGSNDFLPVTMCPIAAPMLWQAVEALQSVAQVDATVLRWLGQVAEVEFFCTGDESELQMLFLLSRGNGEGLDAVCERLRRELPELRGAGAEPDPALNRAARRAMRSAAWGAAGLTYAVEGREYWVGRGAFFQVNRWMVGRLVDTACAGLEGVLAWDLFAGVGLFTQVLADRFEEVVAVEGAPAAVAALAAMSKRVAREGRKVKVVDAAVLEFLRGRLTQRERPDAVLLDPPRAGLGAEGAVALASLRVPVISYVSCDPESLAMDLAVLTKAGYRVDALTMVDMFPQTMHLETVARLSLP